MPDLYKQNQLNRELGKFYTVKLKLKLALDIAEGMNFLHSLDPPIIHRDLRR